MDNLTTKERSAQMRSVPGKNTRPELAIRSLLHRLGYRFRLHHSSLPGRPDVVFQRRRKIILVHGCFWHRHEVATCRLTRTPKSNLGYWGPKFSKNKERDQTVIKKLKALGWDVLVTWECQVRNQPSAELEQQLRQFLGPTRVARVSSGVAASE